MFGALVPVFSHSAGGGPPPATGLSTTITIDGVDLTLLVHQCSWSARIGQIGTASLTLQDPGSFYDPEFEFIPLDGQVIQVTIDGTLRWAGQITRVKSAWLGHILGGGYEIDAQDWMHLPQREPFNGILASTNLGLTLATLTGVGTSLAAQGLTLAGSQASGPVLGVITGPWQMYDTLLRTLQTLSGYVAAVTPAKVLEMWAPGAKASGVTFSLANGNVIDADFERQRLDYRNQQWIVFGPTVTQDATDIFTGDGATQDFPLHYSVATVPGLVTVNPGAIAFPVGIFGVDALEWTYDASLGQYGALHHTGTALTGSQTVSATFPSNFPNAVLIVDAAEVAAKGRYGRIDFATDIVTYTEAVAFGTALIRKNKPRPKNPTVVTRDLSVLPGYIATVDLPAIGLNAEVCFAHTVSVELEFEGSGCRPRVTLNLFSGTEPQTAGDASALWMQLLGDGSGAGGGGSIGGGGGSGGTTIVTGGLIRLHFGGWKQINPDLWQSTAGNGVAFDLPEGAEYFLTGSQVPGAVILSAHLLTDQGANGAVSLRLFNETDNVAASDWTTAVTASTLTYVSVIATLAAAEKVYKIQARVSGSAHATANWAPWNVTLWNRP